MFILKTILLQPSTSTLNKGKIEANFYTLLQQIKGQRLTNHKEHVQLNELIKAMITFILKVITEWKKEPMYFVNVQCSFIHVLHPRGQKFTDISEEEQNVLTPSWTASIAF